MARVFFMFKGLPGCGKSTVARQMQERDPAVIVERDIIREELGFLGKPFSSENEKLVTERQERDLASIMTRGRDVISSDTNLNPKCLELYKRLCETHRYILHIVDMTDVPIEDCIARDAQRTGPKCVGEKVIRDMARRYNIGPYKKDEKTPPVPVTDPLDGYDRTRPACVIVDIDGTIAKHGTRNPYDESLVMCDAVRWDVVDAIKGYYHRIAEFSEMEICFLSGRTDTCYDDTFLWIMEKAGFDSDAYRISLSMRKTGDTRRDSIVKNELFNEKIRGKYNVLAAFDDRDQVIRECWLPKGITVFNVGDGSIF